MNRKTDTTVSATRTASYALIASSVMSAAWYRTDSPIFGTLAIVLGIVALGATVSAVTTVIWKKDSMEGLASNEFPAVSGF